MLEPNPDVTARGVGSNLVVVGLAGGDPERAATRVVAVVDVDVRGVRCTGVCGVADV